VSRRTTIAARLRLALADAMRVGGAVDCDALAAELGCSPQTARREAKLLAQARERALVATYATPLPPPPRLPSFLERAAHVDAGWSREAGERATAKPGRVAA
jgi:hypothetical protein